MEGQITFFVELSSILTLHSSGQEAVPSVLGPMSISPDGLKLFTKAIADAKPWLYDPIALRMPWNEEAYNLVDHGKGEKLCFGMMCELLRIAQSLDR